MELSKGQTQNGKTYEGRLKDNPDFSIGYKTDIGFYLIQGERGSYNLLDGLPTLDREEAKYLIIKQEIKWSSYSYECSNRSKFEDTWNLKYDIKYDSRKVAFEYVLQKFFKAFKVINPSLVEEYTRYLNNRYDYPLWEFDQDIMKFVKAES